MLSAIASIETPALTRRTLAWDKTQFVEENVLGPAQDDLGSSHFGIPRDGPPGATLPTINPSANFNSAISLSSQRTYPVPALGGERR